MGKCKQCGVNLISTPESPVRENATCVYCQRNDAIRLLERFCKAYEDCEGCPIWDNVCEAQDIFAKREEG